MAKIIIKNKLMFNKVFLLGRLSKDVEVRNTPSGKLVANCSIATSKNWKDQDGNKQEKTEFTNLVIWGKQAEIFAKYTSKGSKIFIEGELTTRDWIDKNTNQKRYATEVNVIDFKFLDDKKKEETDAYSQSDNKHDYSQEESFEMPVKEEIDISDIPF